ncbi:OmpA family protein [Desulfobotulus alkaliphilus]|uniref:OmpA family protein n=1 Tax=Desulfobotulus alkaliphilus TaxID=622671 RepID=A0A562RQ49_9BACT|nr:OmpA family protein [Desulfobotulus alkaliphilus]TWI71251.1 OmpA family protein [Desulfobotulus alkaliphilus]
MQHILLKCVIGLASLSLMASSVYGQAAFVRGSTVIFEDNLKHEKAGEFPSQWRLVRGSAEVARYEGENVLSLLVTRTEVAPLMREKSYLPQAFTIEFDYLMNDLRQHAYEVSFFNENGRRSGTLRFNGERFTLGGRGGTVAEGSTSETRAGFQPGWRRLALSFNQHELRIFSDGVRVLNVPRFEEELRSFQIQGGRPSNARPNSDAFIRNVVVAEGGMPLYERVMSEGRFSTTEIQFDVNRADIRPESAGVIDQIFQLMRDHKDLRFSVEGHTDSDGNVELNQRLSQQRAESVVRALAEKGVSPDRLTAKGWGASRPVADNATEEGKAQNRRVEFVRLETTE